MFQHLAKVEPLNAAFFRRMFFYIWCFWPGVYSTLWIFCHLSRQMAMFFRKISGVWSLTVEKGKVRTPDCPVGVAVVNQIHTHYMGVSKNRGTPKWMVYDGKALLKWMIWGYHYFWKHPHQESQKLTKYRALAGCSPTSQVTLYQQWYERRINNN